MSLQEESNAEFERQWNSLSSYDRKGWNACLTWLTPRIERLEKENKELKKEIKELTDALKF